MHNTNLSAPTVGQSHLQAIPLSASAATNSPIHTKQNDRLDVSEVATLIENRFGFAPSHANLLAEHAVADSGGTRVSESALATALGVSTVSGPVTAEDLEAATLLLEQLLDPGLVAQSNDADPLDAYREILAEVPPGTELQDYTPEQIEAYNELHKAFMQQQGDQVLHHHHQWHQANGAGGTRGPGSGEAFVTMHRQMISNFEDFVNQGMPDGNWTVPELDPTRPLPPNMGQPSDISPELADRRSNDPNTTRPAFLTVGGNSETPFMLDGKAHHSLEDFETLDDLGRALGMSYHGSVHINLGGTMATFDSPMDPTFYAWHGEVDGVVKEWLQTENGQAWAAENPETAALWGVTSQSESNVGGGIEFPDGIGNIFSNLAVGLEMDADDSGTLDAPEIAEFLQSEYGMSQQQAAKIANYLVRNSDDGIQSGQELANLMGVNTLKYTDTEKFQDAVSQILGGNGSEDTRAIEQLKFRVAIEDLIGQIKMPNLALPPRLSQMPGVSV